MLRATLLTCLVLASASLHALPSGFVPEDLYQARTVTYGNGFRVIMNPRRVGRSVALRLVIDVGSLDFRCAERELPHLAEHLMFSGTGQLDESDLDGIMAALGATWNAFTLPFRTEYQVDVYAGNALDALDVLFMMFSETHLTPERVANAQAVVQAESGGAPGMVRDLMHRFGIGDAAIEAAYREFVPDSRAFCDEPPRADHLGIAEVADFITTHHLPEAMSLVAVGDFDPAILEARLAHTFGRLLPGPRPIDGARVQRPVPVPERVNPIEYVSRTPLSNTAWVSIDLALGQPAPFSAERFALEQLAGHLDARLYETLRVERGLAYTPTVSLVDHGDFSALVLEAEVDPGRAGEALGLMRALLEAVRDQGIDPETLDAARQGHLYRLAAELESNASYADLYVEANAASPLTTGFPDIEARLEEFGASDLRAIAKVRLDTDRSLVVKVAPLLDYQGFGVLAIILLLAITMWGIRRFTRGRVSGSCVP